MGVNNGSLHVIDRGDDIKFNFVYMFLLGNILRTDLQNRTRPLPWLFTS